MASDEDKDGRLNKTEFRFFYTPESYPHMTPIVMAGAINKLDIDKDGKITAFDFIENESKILNFILFIFN